MSRERPTSAWMAEIHRAAFDSPWGEATFEDLLRQPGVLARGDAGGSGFILWRTTLDEAEILTLAVAAEAQGRGVGGALLDLAVQEAGEAKVARMILEVGDRNTAALRLYLSRGFATVGRRRNYYRRAWGYEDALVLAKALAPSA